MSHYPSRFVVVAVGVALAAVHGSSVHAQGGGVRADREVARAVADFNGDGRADVLSIRARSRRAILDTAAWCGAGAKDTGRFDAVMTLAGRPPTRTNLNDLFGGESLSFGATFWQIVAADYNGDGRLDFNLGQYASCNGWSYSVLSVMDDGSVIKRALRPARDIRVTDFANSTRKLAPVSGGGFRATWYDNSRGNVRTLYCWNSSAAQFVIAEEKVGDDVAADTSPRRARQGACR